MTFSISWSIISIADMGLDLHTAHMSIPSFIRRDVALAPKTSLKLGGAAEFFAGLDHLSQLADVVAFARQRGLPICVLGGGSNVIVPDGGVDGVVVQLQASELEFSASSSAVSVTVDSGADWDRFVDSVVEKGWAGLECLTGIPGLVGATPIQNVGAYGQDVSETITGVEVFDLETGRTRTYSNKQCGFDYRSSVFKRMDRQRYVVLRVTFRLIPGGAPTVTYRDLKARLGDSPSLMDVKKTVRDVRQQKSMLAGGFDENRCSAGSFFINPIVSDSVFAEVREIFLSDGGELSDLPSWHTPKGIKLAAAWLIERAGFAKGFQVGRMGLSTKHSLALVHLGHGTTQELLEFARLIADGVQSKWGVRLEREPRILRGASLS